MNTQERWRCNECSTLHNSESGAQSCCDPEKVLVCGKCKKEFETSEEGDAKECCTILEFATGGVCLCGAHLIEGDLRPSMVLGDLVRCERCRAKIETGIPSGEAIRQSFTERGIAVR